MTSLSTSSARISRVVLLGDSGMAGLGVHGKSSGKLAARQLGAEILNLAVSSKTVEETLSDLPRIEGFAPDLAIICCGGTEALVHPGAGIQTMIERWAPATWHGVAGLEPRMYFAPQWWVRQRQRFSSWLKVHLKLYLIRWTYAERTVPVEAYKNHLRQLLRGLEALGCGCILIGLGIPDSRLFPGSAQTFRETNEATAACATEFSSCTYLAATEVYAHSEFFLNDKLHLNQRGHEQLAQLILAQLGAAPS